MTLDQTLFKLEVAETNRGRSYWATRPWLSSGEAIRAADIIIVPWEKFREDRDALFPQGTGDFMKEIAADADGVRIAIAAEPDQYEEVALYANELRWPTVFVSVVALPLLINLLSARIDRIIEPDQKTIEMEILVEGLQGKCLSIKYKGPPSTMLDNVLQHSKSCAAETDKPKPPKPTASKPTAQPSKK